MVDEKEDNARSRKRKNASEPDTIPFVPSKEVSQQLQLLRYQESVGSVNKNYLSSSTISVSNLPREEAVEGSVGCTPTFFNTSNPIHLPLPRNQNLNLNQNQNQSQGKESTHQLGIVLQRLVPPSDNQGMNNDKGRD